MPGIKRKVACFVLLGTGWCLSAAPGLAAVIGNVAAWDTAGQDITVHIDDASKMRLTILAPDTARIRIAPTGNFSVNVSRAVVNSSFPAAAFTVNETADRITIQTAAMRLDVCKQPCVLECRDLAGNLIVSDDPAQRVQWDSGRTEVFKTTQPGEKYVGLGWRTGELVRNGSIFRMRNKPTYSDPELFYASIPLWYGLRDGQAYGVFFDDASWGTIDVGATSPSYMSFRNLGGQVDYYYFAGPDIATILDRYTHLTGRPFMPPRWALGYQQCRWSYYPESQVMEIANELRSRSIPCDVIYLDIDYMPGGRALTFDPAKFPDPAGMLNTLRNMGFRVITNISPFVFMDDPKFAPARDNNYLIRRADGGLQIGWHDYWYFRGGAETGSMAWVDFTDSAARNWWAGQHEPFISLGIDGIWNDESEPNEFGTWPTDVKYSYDGQMLNHDKVANQYCLFETELSYSVLANQFPDRRPFVLSRGGFAGIQRYAALWSGDNVCDWIHDYKRNIPMGLAMSISGNPHNGHDIGGFFNRPESWSMPPAELYARWMQSGVFSPFCRQHHDGFGNNADIPHPFVEPWRFGPTVENICREFIGLRYRLMPYLYTLFHQAHVSGAPVQRPTFYDFPADPATIGQDYDFMVGPYLLVSPVTAPGATTWTTYLPSGANWVDYWTDTLYSGGREVTTATPLERLPIFVRAGAILPMGPVVQYDGQAPLSELTLEIYPSSQPGTFTLYEDDGLSWSYQSGDYARTTFSTTGVGDSHTLHITAREGQFVPAPRSYRLRLHRWLNGIHAPMVNGTPLPAFTQLDVFEQASSGYFYDSSAALLYVRFADTGQETVVTFDGQRPVPGDFDGDDDVDQEDFAHLQSCLTGPGLAQDQPECLDARFDADTDVDDADIVLFLRCFTGPDGPGAPDCLLN